MFKDNMYRAVLGGNKTMTRRIIKLKDFGISDTIGYDFHYRDKRMLWNDVSKERLIEIKCPYQVGDIVGIKENFYIMKLKPTEYHSINFEYNIDREFNHTVLTDNEWAKYRKWKNQTGSKSKLFMFDSLIRNKIEITDIRVERINDISIEDCIAEGVTANKHKSAFEHLWDSINKKRGYGWDKNNRVFVYGFKLVNNGK